MTRCVWIAIILPLVVGSACSHSKSERDDARMSDLLEHLKAKGVEVEVSPKLFALLGAVDGNGLGGGAEAYRFDGKAKAEALGRSGLGGSECKARGYFALCTSNGKLIEAFSDF